LIKQIGKEFSAIGNDALSTFVYFSHGSVGIKLNANQFIAQHTHTHTHTHTH